MTIDPAPLRTSFMGEVLAPGDEGYDAARRVWNAMVDRRPALIARCTTAADVAAAVRFARGEGLDIAVRCGGHSVSGLGVADGGLMIDLSPMQGVRVDPDRRRAWVQGGALLGNLDRATQAHGLATTAGNVSHTGVGGLTLGGGMGWLARQHGLACDNVLSYEVVTADGDIVRASATERDDLFWGLRGGGGNFGVVTEFEFRLHRSGNSAFMADLFFEPDDGPAVMRRWRERIADAPLEATLTAWAGTTGEWAFLPRQLVNRPMTAVGFVWVGDVERARVFLDGFRSIGRPRAEDVTECSYLELQSMGDDEQRHALRRYWKGHYLAELGDSAIDAFLARDADGSLTPAQAALLPNAGLQVYGGAIADVDDADSAFSFRDTLVEFVAMSRWEDAAEDAARIELARHYGAALEPFASGVYVNALADEGQAGVRRAYRPDKLARLTALKDRYDPDNVFHLNHNILPSRDAAAAASVER